MRGMMRLAVMGVPGRSGGGLVYQLRDEFATAQAAPMPATLDADPGPGKLVKATDTGNNASIANGDLVIAAAVSDTDPAYYWTKPDGSGFTREDGLALIAYHRNGAWIGWSNSTTPSAAALLYGAKGRSGYAAGAEWAEALPVGDPVHILTLTATGAQHIVRYGTNEYLALTYPTGSDETLYPMLLGDACALESLYVYKVTPPTPAVALESHAQGVEFTHPAGALLVEFDVVALSTAADTKIILREQDAENRLELYITAGRRLRLYKRVENTLTAITYLGAAGFVLNGSRVVIQLGPPGIFQTSSGSAQAKAWTQQSDGTMDTLATSSSIPFGTATTGRLETIPAATTLANFKVWSMTL